MIPDHPLRGRLCIYGERLQAQDVEVLSATEVTIRLYGKEQRVRLRSAIALAPSLLKGTLVRAVAVWCQFYDDRQ